MQIISPLEITDARLTSSTLAEDDTVSEWAAGTYNLDDEAYYEHIVYKVAVASTTDRPDIGAALPTPSWVAIRPTNRWAMFDDRTGTATDLTASAVYVFEPGVRTNSVAFIGIEGLTEINVNVTSIIGGGLVFDETISTLDLVPITDWYAWHTGEPRTKTRVVQFGLPPFSDNVITVTFTGSVDSQLGNFVLGTEIDLGLTEESMQPDIRSNSVVQEDGFGGKEIVKRTPTRVLDVTVGVARSNYDYAFNTLERLVDTPLVYVASPEIESGTVYGIHRRAPQRFGHGVSLLDLRVEGLN